jgi:hypothetical protein
MTREEAVKAVNAVQYDEPAYLNEFLEYHKLTETEYRVCVERFRNQDIWQKLNGRWRLRNELI